MTTVEYQGLERQKEGRWVGRLRFNKPKESQFRAIFINYFDIFSRTTYCTDLTERQEYISSTTYCTQLSGKSEYISSTIYLKTHQEGKSTV